jgi:hypothetical protein
MKAAYEFLAGGSLVTPIGLAIAALVALGLVHAKLFSYAGAALVLVLVITLAGSVLERPN